ncbi:MAG: hypothetical protein WCK58_09100, partial [Chloroflexota bacterium]
MTHISLNGTVTCHSVATPMARSTCRHRWLTSSSGPPGTASGSSTAGCRRTPPATAGDREDLREEPQLLGIVRGTEVRVEDALGDSEGDLLGAPQLEVVEDRFDRLADDRIELASFNSTVSRPFPIGGKSDTGVLTNPFYAGRLRTGEPSALGALVDPAAWEHVQAMRARYSRR